MINDSHLNKLTASLCKLFNTSDSTVAWRLFEKNFIDWYGVFLPTLRPEHKEYIKLLEKQVDDMDRNWNGEEYNLFKADWYYNNIRSQHPSSGHLLRYKKTDTRYV